MKTIVNAAVAASLLAGCVSLTGDSPDCPRIPALADGVWAKSDWIAVPDAKREGSAPQRPPLDVHWFVGRLTNAEEVVSAKWMTSGLGVYELFLNGERIGGADALKPGCTQIARTRYSFTYDVTRAFDRAKGAENVLAAEVSSCWWRDAIVGDGGRKSAFRCVLELAHADGTVSRFATGTNGWTCAATGPVTRAGIYEGESYDARIAPPVRGGTGFQTPVVVRQFTGKVFQTAGAEVVRRRDLALAPVGAYCWRGVTNASKRAHGRVVKTRTFDPKGPLSVAPGETLIVDFGQNCAAVPEFAFSAKPGVTLTCLPGEMLNDRDGEHGRGNDGPGGSIYRANLRTGDRHMRLEYTFGTDRTERYLPRHTFFGYRYLSITTATDVVTISSIRSVPVTSVTKESELGRIETGDRDLNRLIANVYWGQLSNYLSIPTDCPQRNERWGWTADTQVFAEAGSFNADTSRFFHKWMRDMRDSQGGEGGFPSTAPNGGCMRLGWADAGVIVPYQVWKQFGDKAIVDENWEAMARYVDLLDRTKADHEANKSRNSDGQFADWLSYESIEGGEYETVDGKRRRRPITVTWWNYLLACYWMWDAQMMAEMARGTGRDPAKWTAMAAEAKAKLKANFFEKDGLILTPFRKMQTAALFALKLGLVEGDARAKTLEGLRTNVRERKGCLSTGFLGTSILMDSLTEAGAPDLAYDILLNHGHPGWLYSVDQGATAIWERWGSYTKERGFGPAGMNSFNHYAYGAVLAWIYKTAAGIAADPAAPGFKSIVMRPVPDPRLGFVKAEYKSAAGLVKSAWRYEGETWIWEFTVPEGATARVTPPGEKTEHLYRAGTYTIKK